MKKINKNSLIYKWANDKNPVGISGKPSKKIQIKHVANINKVLNEAEPKSNEQED